MKYEEIEHKNNDYYIEQLNSNNKKNVVNGLLGLALYGSDFEFIQDTLVKFSKNDNENIRGIAILGFGHLGRLHGKIDKDVVLPIVKDGMKDKSKFIRGQSNAALEDIISVLYEELQKKERKVGLDGLKDNEKHFFLTYSLLTEINKGFEEYFKNSLGQYCNEAVLALDTFNLNWLSELVKKAKVVYENDEDDAIKFDLLSELDDEFLDKMDYDGLDEKWLSLLS